MNELFVWTRFFENIPKILPSLSTTLLIVCYATFFGSLLAALIVMVQLKKVPVLHSLVKVYISFMRGTPMLVQMMIIYYGIPMLIDQLLGTNINREWSPMYFACITFALNQSAFLSAIFYSAFIAIPKGQTEAALSVGLTGVQVLQKIILPQMIPIAVPPFGHDLMGLFQNSSLVFFLGVVDLMGRAKAIGITTKHVLEAYVCVMLLYILISLSIRLLFFYLTQKLDYKSVRIRKGRSDEF